MVARPAALIAALGAVPPQARLGGRGLGHTFDGLWNPPYFRHALPFGVAALVVAVLIGLAWSRRRAPAPVAGLVLAGCALLGLDASGLLPDGLVVGVGLLLAGGLLAGRTPILIRPLLALPGAWWIATHAGLVPWTWARVALIVMTAVGGTLVGEFDEHYSPLGAGPVLLAVTAVGLYFTVPDTYQAAAVLAVALPLALAAFPLPLTTLGRAGSMAAVGVLAWVVVAGGYGRPPSIVGGVACLGLFAVEPIGRGIARAEMVPRSLPGPAGVAALAAGHAVLIYAGGRVAGTQGTVLAALLLVGIEAAAAVALVAAVATSRGVTLRGR